MTRAGIRGRAKHRRTEPRPGGEDALGHTWHTEASSTRGDTLQRCARCHVASHWHIAKAHCVPTHIPADERAAEKRREKPATTPRRVLAIAKTCARCSTPYTATHGRSMYCSQQCQDAAAQAASKERARDRRRAVIADPAALVAYNARVARHSAAYRARRAGGES
jgi:hypothetical protein